LISPTKRLDGDVIELLCVSDKIEADDDERA
jgi:hypothetical protein